MVTDTLNILAQNETAQQVFVIVQGLLLVIGAILHLFQRK
ncbi:MAG: hypothetical protein [Arizlama microvirus]|nr:MAG: hypothetical protein [Arizlama microvirus]